MIKETIFCFLFQFSLFKYWFSVAPVVLQDLNSCITHRLLKLYFNIADVAYQYSPYKGLKIKPNSVIIRFLSRHFLLSLDGIRLYTFDTLQHQYCLVLCPDPWRLSNSMLAQQFDKYYKYM
jgi:hypothetical protein